MVADIERLDRKRMAFLKWYLVGFVVSLALMLARHFFRESGLNQRPIGAVVLVGAVAGLLLQAVCVALSAFLERDIHQDPRLEAALHDELVQSLMSQSWVAAYIGASAMTLFFAIMSPFYPVCDPVTIALTSIAAGAGANRAYFYFRYRAS